MTITDKTLRAALSAALLGVAPIVAVPLASAAAPAQDARIDQAVGALRAISTMRADFVQTDRNGQRIGGVMTLKRPGRIRFEYQKGVPLLIVSDGSALTMIDYGVAQVQRWPIRNSPLGALLSPDRDVAGYARVQPGGSANQFNVQVRDPRHPEYGVITMVFVRKPGSPGGLELSGWTALDAQNHQTSVRLTNQRYGLAVADATFRWRDPRTSAHH